jgi:hypothetical protein
MYKCVKLWLLKLTENIADVGTESTTKQEIRFNCSIKKRDLSSYLFLRREKYFDGN